MSVPTTVPPIDGDRGPVLLPDVEPIAAIGVLLHVGVHKTGTTAIQAALADARPELKAADVLYPGKRQAQHRAALAVLERTWGWKDQGGVPPDRAEYERLVKQVHSHVGRVVVSSEFLCETDAEAAEMMAHDLGRDRLHVVVTLRNLGRLLPSSWQQYLKYGLTTRYEKWLRSIFENPGKSSMTPTFWRRHDHGAVLSRWTKAVGAENVTVMIVDEVDRSAQFRTFAQLLDVDPEVLVSRMDLTSNRSMTAPEAELLMMLNKRVKSEMTWDEYVKFVRRGVALGMVEGRTPKADEPRLHTPDWALDAAQVEGAKSAETIRALGVRVLGNVDSLAARLESSPEVAVVERDSVPVDAAVQAIMTVIAATRDNSELSAKGLRDELWQRTKSDMRERWRLRSLRP